jgi:hypothetical protein
MIIYGVAYTDREVCGYLISHLFKRKTDAIMEAASIAKRYNDEHGDDFKLQPDGLTWRYGFETIKVREYKLI